MWSQPSNQNHPESKNGKICEDSGIVDSGFVSDNLLVSNDISEDIEDPSETLDDDRNEQKVIDIGLSSMRVDSGVDIGISESLSHLSIKNIGYNQLSERKELENVQSEPVLEPIIVKADDREEREIEQWQLYYIQDCDGDTQLHIAIIQGFLEAAAFSLIKMAPHPCLLDILNDDGQAPLHLAVLTRQPRIVRRLILGGADPSLRDSKGNTALHLACAASDLAAARALTDPLALIERSHLGSHKTIPAIPQNLEQINYQGETCLHIAAARDQVDMVRLLLRLGADLEAREGLSGKTALHIAIEKNSRSVVYFLLNECRPCLDAPNYAGMTPYQIAIYMDSPLASDLVKRGATPEPLPESDSEMSDDSSDDDDDDDEDVHVHQLARIGHHMGVKV